MRKINIILFVLLSLVITSCTDYLDLAPKNQRAVEGLTDIKQVFSGYLRGFGEKYGTRSEGPEYVYSDQVLMMFESYSDNIDFETSLDAYMNPRNNSVRGNKEQFYADHFLWNQFSAPESLWRDYYDAIGFLNAMVDAIVEVADDDQQTKDQVEGEIRIHRAYYIFKLLQYFAPYDNADLGIPVYLHTGEQVVGIKMPRKSHAEVYSIILEDLNIAKELLGRTGPKETFNVFYNNRHLSNLLAQVYWFKAESPAKESSDYENAKAAAIEAIQGVEGLIPTTTANFLKLGDGTFTDYPGVYQYNFRYFAGISPIYGSPYGREPKGMTLSQDFLDLFTPGDIRFGAMVNTSDSTSLNSVWPDGSMFAGKRGSYHFFQPEQAYLILAEAYYRLQDENNCRLVLNDFKSLRNAGTADGLSGEALLQEVKNERRKEFFGKKDYRWLDLKRYGDKTISRTLTFFEKEYTLTAEPNSFYYALPIPLSEIEQNPDLIPNEGWIMKEYK